MGSAARKEALVRRRRMALLVAAAVVAVPIAVAVRRSNDWTVFGAALVLLMIFGVLGSVTAMGPWTREAGDWQPKPTDDPPSSDRLRRHPDEGEQLVLSPQKQRAGAHARH